MVSAHFECRHISQFKGLIDVFNYWKWKDKERAKLKEEMLVQFQTETPFDYWIITGAVELGFRSDLYRWKAKIYA
jgi:hypothetical protein